MARVLFDVLAVLLVLTILRARPAVVLGVLGASLLVVPGPFVVPNSPTSLLTLPHLITLAGVARVVLGRFDGSVTRRHLRVTPPQLALLALLAVAVVAGFALSPATGPLGAAPGRLADVLDHVLFLTVALVLVRQSSPAAALNGLALGLLVGLAVAVVERVTGDSFGHWVFTAVDDVNQSAAFPLSERQGSLRVRAGTEFALQFAWIAAMLAPSLLLVAWRRGGAPLAAAAAALTLSSVLWSYSRTALAATALLVLLTAVVLARRAGLWVLVSVSVLGAAALLQSEALRAHLNLNSDLGSVQERTRRLGSVMEVASQHPFRGVGLGELTTSGFRTTDFAFLLAYVEMGVIGLVAVTACLLFALRAVVPALLTADPTERDEALAAAACVGTFVLSTATYDAFTLVQGTHALWLGVAAGIVLLERRRPDVPPLRWSSQVLGRAAGATTAGLLVGLVAVQLAPRHTAQEALFTVIEPALESQATYDPVTGAKRFINTVCALAEQTRGPGVKVSCSDTFGAAGHGRIRLQAPNSFALRQAFVDLTSTVRVKARLSAFQLLPVEEPRTGRDTWARTAPVWVALSGGVLALLLSPSPATAGGRGRRRAASGGAAAAPVPAEPGPAAPVRR